MSTNYWTEKTLPESHWAIARRLISIIFDPENQGYIFVNILHVIKGRKLTRLVTSFVGIAFYGTLLKERSQGC